MNYVEILVTTIVAFALGAIWYGPVFGKTWMKLANISMDEMKNMALSPKQAMGLGFISTIVYVWALAWVIEAFAITAIADVVMPAFVIWLGFIATTLVDGFLWKGESFKLFLFNIAYQAVQIAIISSILVSWV